MKPQITSPVELEHEHAIPTCVKLPLINELLENYPASNQDYMVEMTFQVP